MKSVLKTQEQIEKELKDKFDYLTFTTNYTGANDKIGIKCNKCGHEWKTTARSVIGSKMGCSNCGKPKQTLRAEKDFENKIDLNKFEIVEYINHSKAVIKCKDCGTIRKTNVDNLKRYGCKFCKMKIQGELQRKTAEQFISEAKLIYGNKYDYSKVEYKTCKDKVIIICPDHGEFLKAPIKHLYDHQGCPLCNDCSKGEMEIIKILKDLNLEFNHQYYLKINNKKYFIDFFIPKYNLFIEFNGRQHYEPIEYFGGQERYEVQIERDNFIRDYCKENKIKILEIKYDTKDIKQNILEFIESCLSLQECKDENV